MQFGELKNVQVFRTGHWADLDFDDAALEAMVANFRALKDVVKPRLKLGHAARQILDQPSGQPALGWISDLRKAGEFLEADFSDVPSELLQAINAGRYKDVSIEAYPTLETTNLERNLKTGRTGPMITACAILGSDLPEVKGLKDLPRITAAEQEPSAVRIDFTARPMPGTLRAGTTDEPHIHPRSPAPMADDPKKDDKPAASAADVIALREQLKAQETQLATFTAQDEARKVAMAAQEKTAADEAKTLKAQIAALEQRNAAAEATARAARAREFVATCSSKECLKLVTPAEQAAARRLHEALAALPEQVVTFSEDGKDVKRTLLADFEALIQARPDAKALLTEVSRATKPTTAADSMDDVVKLIAAERKLDTSKPTWKRDATIILCSEDPYKTTYAHLITPPGPARTTH